MTQELTIPKRVENLRASFNTGLTRTVQWRRLELEALRKAILENQAKFEQALKTDLGKPETEAYLTEIGFVLTEIDHTLKNLNRWLKAKRVSVPLSLAPAKARIVREPLGVVLIISPWNYPFMLALSPLVGAIAAGNTAVIKPSELAPATSAALAEVLPKYLQTTEVVEGAVPETTQLLEQKFDHIFYTGSGRVGSIIMSAAAKQLTPVTLELGGKSPAFIDEGIKLEQAADRIVWAKWLNAGQTCVAPDYLITTPGQLDSLVKALETSVRKFFGEQVEQSPDYARIVNSSQFDRLKGYLETEKVAFGGDSDPETRFMAPTVLLNPDLDSAVMQDEIFGPILPIITVPNLDEAIKLVNSKSKPLALYVFSNSEETKSRWQAETSSGALAFNIAVAHLTAAELPFGGVGESGIGAYHGERSISTFSHEKAVLSKGLTPDTMKLIYPPYTEKTKNIIRKVISRLS